MTVELIDARALDGERREFRFGGVVQQGRASTYTCDSEPGDSPVAEAVLAVPGVHAVTLDGETAVVVKQPAASWEGLEEQVRYALQAGAAQLTADRDSGLVAAPLDDDAMYDLVADLFRREINPSVARHGGKIELIDVESATVVVRMQGGCQGCGMASVTLKQGIEGSLRRMIPGFVGVKDITDHASGTDPYFESQKK